MRQNSTATLRQNIERLRDNFRYILRCNNGQRNWRDVKSKMTTWIFEELRHSHHILSLLIFFQAAWT